MELHQVYTDDGSQREMSTPEEVEKVKCRWLLLAFSQLRDME